MSSVTKDAAGAAGKRAQKKAKVPKTVLEKLAAAIIALDSPQEGGSSRQVTISKSLCHLQTPTFDHCTTVATNLYSSYGG